MDHHHFTDNNSPGIPIPYNLVFSVRTRDIIPLPAHALFDPVARGGYRIMHADIIAYRKRPGCSGGGASAVGCMDARSSAPRLLSRLPTIYQVRPKA